jgi:predicted ester cyclase
MQQDSAAAVRRMITEVWNNGNLDVADEYLHPEYTHHDPQSPSPGGAEGFKAVVQAFRAAFPDLVIRIDDLIVTEDRVVIRYRASGTHHGDL